MKRDTILLITTSYPQRADGSEAAGSFVADIAEALAERMPVKVVAPGDQCVERQSHPNVSVMRFRSTGKPLSLLSVKRPSDWPAIVSTLRSLRKQTLAADDDRRIFHTLGFWALPSGWAASCLHKRDQVPYSVWALGSDIWTLGNVPIVRQVLRGVLRNAARRFADGLALAREAELIGGARVDFLPSSRKLSGIRMTPLNVVPPYTLLFIGRWHKNKGIDILLDALLLLDDHDWRLIKEVHIAGGGDLQPLVQGRVQALLDAGLPIRLSGFLDRAQATKAMGDADYLLIPSRIESIPIVFSDAMKMDLPVITMPVGDLPRLFEEDDIGFVAKEVTPFHMAEQIKSAIRTQNRALFLPGMKKNAQRFSIDNVIDTISSLR